MKTKKSDSPPVVEVKLSRNKKDWYVTAKGRVVARPDTKQDAIDLARDLADQYGIELLIHSKYGQVYRHSFNDGVSREKEDRIRKIIREVYNLPMGKFAHASNGSSH